MICASSGDLTELGNLVLERSDDLGLEGPCVGGQSGLSMQRCLGSLLNLGPSRQSPRQSSWRSQ